HSAEIDAIVEQEAKINRLCELNVIEQVNNVCSTTIVRNAWKAGKTLSVHGWIYSISDGILHDLGICVTEEDQ
ncbi:MAG: carbonic anhydrase, partial [Caldilineaceae bacterium]|nr:carbonic anhydrase [Caldilineaceae bacterium]